MKTLNESILNFNHQFRPLTPRLVNNKHSEKMQANNLSQKGVNMQMYDPAGMHKKLYNVHADLHTEVRTLGHRN